MSATVKKEEVMELAIAIEGKILSDNFDEFKGYAIDKIEGMKYELLTEDDFKKAAKDVKALNAFEKSIDITKESMLKQMDEVYAKFQGMDELRELSKECRLSKSSEIKSRRVELREKLIASAVLLINHDLRDRFRPQIEKSIKGKSSLDVMSKTTKKEVEVVNADIEACQVVLESFENEHGKTLIPDASTLELGNAAQLKNELAVRIERRDTEIERKRLEAERIKAEAELAELKRKEAEEAKPKEEEHGKTALVDTEETLALTPAKVGSIPVSNTTATPSQDLSEGDEFEALKRDGRNVLRGLKEIFEGLEHSRNIELANAFRKQVNDAWVKMVEGGSK